MDSSPEITLPSDDELQGAGESEHAHKNFKKTSKTKKRIIETPKEELKYREKKSDVLEKEQLSCTSCGKNLTSVFNQKQFSLLLQHPVLGVLLCKSCSDFYGEGEFSVDEDGTDKYCRWCGQGGTLYLCSECNFGFCRACIKRNLQRSILKDVEEDDWKCFACKPYPLWDLRATCAAALKYIQENKKTKRKLEIRSHTKKSSHKSKMSSSESEREKVTKKAEKKMKSRDISSDTSEKRKRKRNVSSSEESQQKKKKKYSSSLSNEKNEQSKSLYDKEVDRKTTLDTRAAETLSSECKNQIQYFLKFLRVMTVEVKNVLKEEVAVENLKEYAGRKQLYKKIMMLEEMSCQTIVTICEKFVVGYRKTLISCLNEDLVKEDEDSDNTPKVQGENISNEKMEDEEEEKEEFKLKKSKKSTGEAEKMEEIDTEVEENGDCKLFEKSKKSTVKGPIHQLSESDNTDEELCTNAVNESGKNDSESENLEEVTKPDSYNDILLDKNTNNTDKQSISELKKSKSDIKTQENNELNKKHLDNSEETEKKQDSQEIDSDDDENNCKQPFEKETENGCVNDLKIADSETLDNKEIGQDTSKDKNKQEKKSRNADISSIVCSEKEKPSKDGKESEVNDLLDDENKDQGKANEMQETDLGLKTHKQVSKKCSVGKSAEENSGSDKDSLDSEETLKEKPENSSDATPKRTSNEKELDSGDETSFSRKKQHENDVDLTEKVKHKTSVSTCINSDEDVISDSGSERRKTKNNRLSGKYQENCSLNTFNENNVSDREGDDLALSEGKACAKENSSNSGKDILRDRNEDDVADSDGRKHDKKSSHKDVLSDSDKDNVTSSDGEIRSKGATPSSHKDEISDTEKDAVILNEQIYSDDKCDKEAVAEDEGEADSSCETVDNADQNEDASPSGMNLQKTNKEHIVDEEKEAMLALLASSSSDEDHIRFRKRGKTFAGDKENEKCGPFSSKSLAYQKSHKKDQRGVFSDASEGMGEDSDNKLLSENGESVEIPSEKLQKCSVVVKRLPEKMYQKYWDSSSSTKDREEKISKEEEEEEKEEEEKEEEEKEEKEKEKEEKEKKEIKK